MDWAARRRFNIMLIIGVIVVALIGAGLFLALYEAPTCSDKKQNQDESGVDCGGACSRRCIDQEVRPTVLYTTLLRNAAGRTDLVASIENRNSDAAAKAVPYTIRLFTAEGTFVKEVKGTLDLPVRATVPVFIPGVVFGGPTVARAFLDIASTSVQWFGVERDVRVVPIVEVRPLGGTTQAPRVEATLTNTSLVALSRVSVIALVHDSVTGNVIAASSTVVPNIAPQGKASALFTWNEPFSSASVRVEVVPVIALP